jgi:hypothetical protein
VLVSVSAHGSARTELRLGVYDLLDDGEQVEGAAQQAVNACHRHHVAEREDVQHFQELAAVVARAGHLLTENLGASRTA